MIAYYQLNGQWIRVLNIDSLPRGLNAPYLKCVLSPDNTELVARSWHRKVPPERFCERVLIAKEIKNKREGD